MERHEVVRQLGLRVGGRSYLEIGVNQGLTFNRLRFDRKVAVDPKFLFDVATAAADPINAGADFLEITSDDYFSRAGSRETFDIIFLDGLHTFDQTLRDLLNAVTRLESGGVILVDDVLPTSYGAALSDESQSARFRALRAPNEHAWMGDVYRVIFFVHDYLADWSFATVAENHGQTVIWKAPRALPARPRSVEQIARLSFADLVVARDTFNVLPLSKILEALPEVQKSHR